MKFPVRIGVYLTYEDLFQETPPQNRVELIQDYSKKYLLTLFSLINLYPKDDFISHTIVWEKQLIILEKICIPNHNLFKRIAHKINRLKAEYKAKGAAFEIFTRTTNVIAINEILESKVIQEEN